MTDLPKKKFTGRCRLFVGNLPNEVKEAELKELFSPHGDIAECYLSGKGFAFLRMVTLSSCADFFPLLIFLFHHTFLPEKGATLLGGKYQLLITYWTII